MKKLITMFLFCLMAAVSANAQIYERKKPLFVSVQHGLQICGEYKLNNKGLYEFVSFGEGEAINPDKFLEKSNGNEHFFIVDKKANKFYFYSDNFIGFYNPNKKWPMEDTRKGIKESKVPFVISENTVDIVNIAKNVLDVTYNKKNDSIIKRRNEEIEKINKQHIKDSIDDAIKKQNQLDQYRKNNNWRNLNAGIIQCNICNEVFREVTVISFNLDTVFFFNPNGGTTIVDNTYNPVHCTKLSNENNEFRKYKEIWKDSIEKHTTSLSIEKIKKLNEDNYQKFLNNIIKEAPYGYIKNWGWELNSVDGIEPYFSFFNLSNKTIRYIDFYFSIFNAVGDRCFLKYNNSYVGHVRGVGPINTCESASWEWDSATHYTSGDASEMKVVKLVITYMDKTVKVLTGNSIKFE